MRPAIKQLVNESIIFECHLPHKTEEVSQSAFTTWKDFCYKNDDSSKISEIIYNSIIEYANNEYEIDYNNLGVEQIKALNLKIRYDQNASETTKQKYGFYGEVLLHAILQCKFGKKVLISKGYFFNPLERSEAKGYDAYHLSEKDGKVRLWFGESKFYVGFKAPIKKIIKNLEFALSDEYLNRNFLAIINEKDHITTRNSKIELIINEWSMNPKINLIEQINKYDISLVYPMFVAFENNLNNTYLENIKKCIDYTIELFEQTDITIPATFRTTLFFIFLPINNVKEVKGDVIKWITSKKPLI